MSTILFSSRIYDKEAPFITPWSLSGEVHEEKRVGTMMNNFVYFLIEI